MTDASSFTPEVLLQLTKEELVEMICLQSQASEAVKTAAEQAVAEISHHAARMGAAMQTALDEFQKAGVSFDTKWSAMVEEIRRRQASE